MKHFALDFLRSMYPDPIRSSEHGGRLVVWSLAIRGRRPRCHWVDSIDKVAQRAMKLTAKHNVRFGVALQDPDMALALAREKRPKATMATVPGCARSATAVPAMWAEIALANEADGRDTLPATRAEALGLLAAIPHRPSITVRTGYGYQIYWLLREIWILDSTARREAATLLLRRIQEALYAEGRRHGWTVEPAADLARTLPLPATLIHRLGEKRPVIVDELRGDRRYLPSEFDVLTEPEDARDAADQSSRTLTLLVGGLAELLDALGRPATAADILRELGDKPAGYAALRMAIEDLFPHLRHGELPPATFGYKLRTLRGQAVGGLAVHSGPRRRGGVTWSVRPIEPFD